MLREIRRINDSALYHLCVENMYFTGGNNKQYEKLFEMAKVNNLTTARIVKMASWIAAHSDLEDGNSIENICTQIANKSYTFFEEK